MRTVAHGVIRGFAMDKTETDLLREEKGSGAILFGTALASVLWRFCVHGSCLAGVTLVPRCGHGGDGACLMARSMHRHGRGGRAAGVVERYGYTPYGETTILDPNGSTVRTAGEEKGSGAILFGTALAFAFPVETGSRLALCR